MIYLMLAVGVLLGLWGLLIWYRTTPPHSVARTLRWVGLLLAIGLGAFLVVYGRISWLWTIIPLLAPWLSPQILVGKLLRKLLFPNASKPAPNQEAADEIDPSIVVDAQYANEMSLEEARLILGVEEGASVRDIHLAYNAKLHQARTKSSNPKATAQIIEAAYRCLTQD